MDRAGVHAAIDAFLDAMEADPPARAQVDEIVPFTREGITAAGLDYAPCLAAAQHGTLRTVWQGRRRFTTRAWLVAYVIALPAAVSAAPVDDDLAIAARRMRVAR